VQSCDFSPIEGIAGNTSPLAFKNITQVYWHTAVMLHCVILLGIRNIQGGSNMTGTDCGLFTHKSVLVIFESPCKLWNLRFTAENWCSSNAILIFRRYRVPVLTATWAFLIQVLHSFPRSFWTNARIVSGLGYDCCLLGHYATSWKVAGSIPNEVIGFFQLT
jgi:hypothetical protein